MKALYFDTLATPADEFAGLKFGEVPTPEPQTGEALVRIAAASINPGDFLFLQGLYPEPKIPVFPGQIAGGHGAGYVVTPGLPAPFEPGTLVAFSSHDVWAEYAAVPLDRLIPLAPDYPLEKAAQFLNLITAWDLLDAVAVEPGRWLAVTAGAATVSTMLSQFAARRGVKVISIVRQVSAHQDLKALGADMVIALDEAGLDLPARLAQITGPAGLAGAIDCVGGPIVGDLVRSLGRGCRLVIYGGFAEQPFELHNFDILMRDASIRAYFYRYFVEPLQLGDLELMARIAGIAGGEDFKVAVGGFHPLSDHAAAIRESLHRPQAGKRFFQPSSAPS